MDARRARRLMNMAQNRLSAIKTHGEEKILPPGTWWKRHERYFLSNGCGNGDLFDKTGKVVDEIFVSPGLGYEPLMGCPFPDNAEALQAEAFARDIGKVAAHMAEIEEAIRRELERILGG